MWNINQNISIKYFLFKINNILSYILSRLLKQKYWNIYIYKKRMRPYYSNEQYFKKKKIPKQNAQWRIMDYYKTTKLINNV